MPIQRMTAKKVRISELVKGRWVKREGMEPSFVVTDSGEKVSRARLLGTLVDSFLAEDGNFGSVTLDDGTDTIRAKTFKTVKPLDEFRVGELVEMIGKVKEYNGEVYLIPEVITRVEDPNRELLRRLELLKKARDLKGRPPEVSPEEVPPSTEDTQQGTSRQAALQEPKTAPQEDSQKEGDSKSKEEKPPKDDDSQLRKEILAVIESDPEGVEYRTIIEKVGKEESRVESVLNEILAEGICYEPTPGRVKKI